MKQTTSWITASGLAIAVGLAGAIAASPAVADEVADFYKGREIKVIIPYSVGGSFGAYGRLVARHLGKHIPGNPSFITDHSKQGGGGIRGANYLYNQAPKDGSEIGVMPDAIVVAQLLFPDRAKFDAGKMRYIGRMTPVNPVLMIRGDHPVKSMDDALKQEVIVSCSGRGSQDYIMPRAMQVLAGAKFRLVCGYKGSAPQALALERGDIDATSSAWASWKFRKADDIKSGKLRPLVQVGLEREVDLPDVPLMQDITNDADVKSIFEFLSLGSSLGRSISTPPGVPEARVAALRKAFEAMTKDPEYLADAKKQRLDLKTLSGAELDKVVARGLATRKDLVERARAAMAGNIEECKVNCEKKK